MRHLTNEELQCHVSTTEMRRVFDASILETIGPAATTQDFPADNLLTPKYDAFDPDLPDLNHNHGKIEVTPEYGDNYVGAEILLPRGGIMTRGRVTERKWDIDGNPKGLANQTLFLTHTIKLPHLTMAT
jgi:hypothetical protein